MRRSFLKLMTYVAGSAALGNVMIFGGRAWASPAASNLEALRRPALSTSKGTGAVMLAIALAGKRLVAVGERGIVLLSDDDGKSWIQAKVPVSVTLTALQFVDERQGWAIGHMGIVLHTADGGVSWVPQLDGMKAAALVMREAQRPNLADAGDSERRIATAQALIADGPDKPFLDLYFENERTGYVIGAYNLIFRTDDGGTSWRAWTGRVANPKGLHLCAIKAAGDTIYIAGEQGLLLRSTDRGQNFTAANSPAKGSFFGLVIGRQGQLLLYGLRGRAFWSGDGAETWAPVETGTHASLSAGVRLADGSMVLASQAGELLISVDDGRSFGLVKETRAPAVTDLVQLPSGRLIVSSLRGLSHLDMASVSRGLPR